MAVDALLSRLDKVRKTGNGRWTACCPAHDDGSPSLSIRELEDGRVLLHDFAGCSVSEVLDALGMEFTELFPEKPLDHRQARERRPFNAHDILACLAFESIIVLQCANALLRGQVINETDKARLLQAATRFQTGARLANG